MPKKVRISFDFDGTLTEPEVTMYAEDLIERGFDVWIITARMKKDSAPVFEKARDLGINKEHVVFTELEYKYNAINIVNPVFHVDDDWIESKLIKTRGKRTIPIQYGYDPDWTKKAGELLEPYLDEYGEVKE